jgi:type IV pilus assembly protein PilA
MRMLRKIRKLLKKQEGFTLVELMIVVVILGILAGIGVQQYGNIQERAKKAADEANRKVLTNAANMWLIMKGGFEEDPEAEDPNVVVFTREDNDLVPEYVDEWPTVPGSNGQYYTVTITKKVEEDGSERYSIKVTAPEDPEEV